MDKLKLTGSVYQLINGIVLISTFFFCRLIWGSVNSIYVFRDVWMAMQNGGVTNDTGLGRNKVPYTSDNITAGATGFSGHDEDIMRFAGPRVLPVWLALSYLAANIVLNVLNYYWFAKMIATLRKRFDPPLGTKGVGEKEDTIEVKTEAKVQEKVHVQQMHKGVYEIGGQTVEAQGRELRSRRRG